MLHIRNMITYEGFRLQCCILQSSPVQHLTNNKSARPRKFNRKRLFGRGEWFLYRTQSRNFVVKNCKNSTTIYEEGVGRARSRASVLRRGSDRLKGKRKCLPSGAEGVPGGRAAIALHGFTLCVCE